MDEKGIISLDAFFATVVMVIIIGMLANLTLERMNAAENIGNLGRGRMIVEEFSNAIDMAYTNGRGFSINITLEPLKSNSGDDIGYTLDMVSGKQLVVLTTNLGGEDFTLTNHVMVNKSIVGGIPVQINGKTEIRVKNTGEYWNPRINVTI